MENVIKPSRGINFRHIVRSGDMGQASSWSNLTGAMRPSGMMNEIQALNLSAFWRGVKVLAGDLTGMSLEVFHHLPSGKGKSPDYDHNVYRLVTRPNRYQHGRKLRMAAYIHLILFGNAYIEIIRDDETGRALRLELLDPRLIRPSRQGDGALVYRFQNGTKSPWTGHNVLLPENVLHFADMAIDGDLGLSGVQVCSESIGLGMNVQAYSANLFENMAIPQGVIECPPGWDELARNNFANSWHQEHGGIAGSNRLAILEEGAKFVATSFNPEQLQLLAAREFTVVEVSRILGLPPYRLGDMSHEAGRSLSEQSRDYYQTSLRPYCTTVEDEIGHKLFAPWESDYFVEHNMNDLVRDEDMTRCQANEIRMRNGVLLINEWRAEDGRNPYAEDGRVLPLNMSTASDNDVDLDPNPAEADPASDPQPAEVNEAARSLARDAIGKVVRRELRNLRRHAEGGKIDPAWLSEYYRKESQVWRDALGPSLALYASTSRSKVDPASLVSNVVQRSRTAILDATDLEGLLTEWEQTKTADLLALVEGR